MKNRVRIVGGTWRSRLLRFPAAAGLRPTADRIRETLFNWLGQTLDGLTCLDLFAGSGALGFEAASRGARAVTLVERDPRVFRALLESCRSLGAQQVEVLQADALAFLGSDARCFDLVFLDPPYQSQLLPAVLGCLPPHLAAGARIYLEAAELPEIPRHYNVLRQGRAGQAQCLLVQWRPDEHSP
ncbi:MAG: 16S rRNA (guanine(966)-N(2))-methyltransferase RsmD [Burkholderiales bacterium]